MRCGLKSGIENIQQ